MCNISKETILRANKKVSCSAPIARPTSNGRILVSTHYMGTTYSQSISMEVIRSNYEQALNKSCNGKRI